MKIHISQCNFFFVCETYILKSDHTPESKMLVVEENMARALTLRWGDYDLAKAVSY